MALAGLLLLAAGIVILAVPAEEPHIETTTLEDKTWHLNSTVLASNDTLGPYGSLMNPGRSFQLSISSSSVVKVEVFIVLHDGGTEEESVFAHTGQSFSQKVGTNVQATYVIYITNESPTEATLDGSVFVLEETTHYSTVYPYIIPGFLLMLSGGITLSFGVLKKSDRSPKSESRHKEKARNQ